jgi:O-antigen/teichoic acid export membrane protein
LLTNIGDAEAVEAVILAAGLVSGAAATSHFYVVADNGIDTGIYRVIAVESADADVIVNLATEITSVVLIGVLKGVADASTLVAANFG